MTFKGRGGLACEEVLASCPISLLIISTIKEFKPFIAARLSSSIHKIRIGIILLQTFSGTLLSISIILHHGADQMAIAVSSLDAFEVVDT